MRTLAELRSFARYMLDEKVETFWEDDEIDLFMNIEYNNLVHEIIASYSEYYEETVSLNTVANSRYVSLPSDHAGKVVAVLREGVPLIYRHKKEMLLTASGEISGSGAPTRFAISGNSLMLDPTPDAVYVISVTQNYIPADMVNNTDVPDIPAGYESLIPLATVLFALLKDKQEMTRIYQLYEKRKQNMFAALKSRQTWEPRRVRKF
jgi:hypothetical protein